MRRQVVFRLTEGPSVAISIPSNPVQRHCAGQLSLWTVHVTAAQERDLRMALDDVGVTYALSYPYNSPIRDIEPKTPYCLECSWFTAEHGCHVEDRAPDVHGTVADLERCPIYGSPNKARIEHS